MAVLHDVYNVYNEQLKYLQYAALFDLGKLSCSPAVNAIIEADKTQMAMFALFEALRAFNAGWWYTYDGEKTWHLKRYYELALELTDDQFDGDVIPPDPMILNALAVLGRNYPIVSDYPLGNINIRITTENGQTHITT